MLIRMPPAAIVHLAAHAVAGACNGDRHPGCGGLRQQVTQTAFGRCVIARNVPELMHRGGVHAAHVIGNVGWQCGDQTGRSLLEGQEQERSGKDAVLLTHKRRRGEACEIVA